MAALSGVAVGVVIVLLVWLIVLMDRGNGSSPAAGSPPTTQARSSAAATPVMRPPAPTNADTRPVRRPIGDVRDLPAGLFCRDLRAKGYSYVASVDYWRVHGQPNQMDADRNGIPCETVYPRSDVRRYWSGRDLPAMTVAAGLFCRDLVALGFSYAEAVAYWWTMDLPPRMDADKNGIPCETVYPPAVVYDFWYR